MLPVAQAAQLSDRRLEGGLADSPALPDESWEKWGEILSFEY